MTMRRSPMQVSVETILDAAGRLEEFKAGLPIGAPFHLRFEQSGYYMPLVIEIVSPNEVSVAHYYEQNGDPMRDPEIVFLAHPIRGWLPIEITQDPFGRFRRAPEGRYLRDVQELARVWARNLREQRWPEVAATARKATTEVTAP